MKTEKSFSTSVTLNSLKSMMWKMALKVDALICGGIGGGAQMALSDVGIRLYGGVSGNADAAAEALVAGKLDFNPNVRCDHHDHHGEGHSCGSHGCGHHSCD